MRYILSRGTQHNYIEDEHGNYLAKTFDTSREGTQRLQQLIQQANAMSGVADPANAIAAAREALEALIDIVEGLDEESVNFRPCAITNKARAALVLLEGVQP